MNKHTVWFRYATWLGMLAEWALFVPTSFAPERVFAALGLRATGDPVWTAFAAWLGLLISLFYLPVAKDPHRYRKGAWLMVFARLVAAVWLLAFQPGEYTKLGIAALVIFLIQLPLLLLALRGGDGAGADGGGARYAVPAGAEKAARWLRRMVWLGVIANFGLGLPAMFLPETVLDLLRLRPTGDPLWTSSAALALLLLSLFYLPGGDHPVRYRANAWLALVARLAGVVFFLAIWPGEYPLFALFDGTFFVLQAPFLWQVTRATKTSG
jgi:hypothetical protein